MLMESGSAGDPPTKGRPDGGTTKR